MLACLSQTFACQHHNLEPDLLCLAKAIAGGLPRGAVLIGSRLRALPKRSHSTTFGGTPFARAAATATIHYIESKRLPQRPAELGTRLLDGLRSISSTLVWAVLQATRAEGGRPRFKLKTGTCDMDIVGPTWGCPVIAYGSRDSALDHTPEEHIEIGEFRRLVDVLALESLAGTKGTPS